jgi:hypothetical protein
VAALERRLEEQERGEERRVKEAYGVGMEAQVKKSEALMEELSQRSKERERKLTWELEEEKRKSQKQRRKEKGIVVKDRLAGRGSRIPTLMQPSIWAGPQWRNWDERWEAANKKKAANSQGDPRAPTTTTGSVAVASTSGEPTRQDVKAPTRQRVDVGKAVTAGARTTSAGRGRGYRRPGRSGASCQTDVCLQVSGTEVVKDEAADP